MRDACGPVSRHHAVYPMRRPRAPPPTIGRRQRARRHTLLPCCGPCCDLTPAPNRLPHDAPGYKSPAVLHPRAYRALSRPPLPPPPSPFRSLPVTTDQPSLFPRAYSSSPTRMLPGSASLLAGIQAAEGAPPPPRRCRSPATTPVGPLPPINTW
jgi:hypothetical protein